jgi:photosystem II stability/assembly factor-like uncharacterized protein
MNYVIYYIIITILISAGTILPQTAWQPLNSNITANLNSIFFLDPVNGWAVGESGTFLKTTDAGNSWTSSVLTPTEGFNAVHFFNANEGIIAADNGIFLRTTDAGLTWNNISSGINDNLTALSFSGLTGICGSSSNSILRTTDGGYTWITVISGLFGGGYFGAYLVNPSTGYLAGQNAIFQPITAKTTDGGANWTYKPFYINNSEGRLFDIYFFDNNNGVTASAVWDGTGGISRTSDGGMNWTSVTFPQALLSVHFYGNTGYAAGLNGAVYKSSDAGLNWSPDNSGTGSHLNDIFIVPGSYAFICGDNGVILKSTGVVPVELTSFTYSIDGPAVQLKWETASETNNHGFEIERKFDVKDSWRTIGFVKGKGTSVGKNVYAFNDDLSGHNTSVTIFYRLKQKDFDGSFTYSGELSVNFNGSLNEYSLTGNYPNPFNPVTSIKYNLPARSSIKLEVYNTAGEKVSDLINQIQEQGTYTVQWHPENLPSGVYFCSMTAIESEGGKTFRETKKMVFMK